VSAQITETKSLHVCVSTQHATLVFLVSSSFKDMGSRSARFLSLWQTASSKNDASRSIAAGLHN